MILLNNFKREYQYLQKDVDKALKKALKSGRYILGENVEKFEKEFARYIGSKYCVGVANGLEALQISLLALGIKPGDEVITVANTAVATALAITNVGAKPVFVEIDEYFHMNASDLERKITKKTKAIIPVHLFGQMVDIEKILKIAKKHNLKVVEDTCQAHGAKIKGKKAGSFGNTGAFSFYPTKNLGTYGDGGAITTNSKDIYELSKVIRNYGQKNRYEHTVKGLNSRLDEIHAAILSIKLKKLNWMIAQRNRLARIYFKELRGVSEIALPQTRKDAYHTFHLFVVQAEKRDALQAHLKSKNIEAVIHYAIPIHKQAAYREFSKIKLPKTENLSKKILSLPVSPFITDSEVKKVCLEIRKFYSAQN